MTGFYLRDFETESKVPMIVNNEDLIGVLSLKEKTEEKSNFII